MIRWLLDTDIVSLWAQGNAAICQRLAAMPSDELAISIVTAEELLGGWYAELRKARTDDRLKTKVQDSGAARPTRPCSIPFSREDSISVPDFVSASVESRMRIVESRWNPAYDHKRLMKP